MNHEVERLQELELRTGYRTHQGPHPVDDFLRPCLKVAIKYDRAAGYFTSTSLRDIEDGLDSLVRRGGKIRLITSPHLTQEDIEEIQAGYDLRDSLNKALARNLEELEKSAKNEIGYLGRLIKDQCLDIRIAYMPDGGLYHEKIGFFVDRFGDVVYFIGSNNATHRAQMINHESFSVFCSWGDEKESKHVPLEQQYFENLWNSQVDAVCVTDLSDVPKEILERCAQELPEDWVPTRVITPPTPSTPPPTTPSTPPPSATPQELRDYQSKAIAAWLQAPKKGCGILKMATGSGKTFTASKAIDALRETLPEEKLLVLITAPTKVLIEQWGLALQELEPIMCYEDVTLWHPKAESYLRSLKVGSRKIVVLISTEDTFGLKHLPKLLEKWNGKQLFIADEVHGYGSQTMRQRLPENASFRLGLSATPESRWPEQTNALFEFFGGVVFTYTLGDAIRGGYLSEYNYHPSIAVLTAEELDEYKKWQTRVKQLYARYQGPPPKGHPDHKFFMAALGNRNAVLDQCESKVDLFEDEIRQGSQSFFQLVYCGSGKSPLNEISQFDQVKTFLAHTLGLAIHDFVGSTSTNTRRKILDDFGKGKTIQVLVAKECLDEGVDIPDARTAYLLASSDDQRQWTQRRGRILRLPTAGTKTAEIFDFITLPSGNDTGDHAEITKSEFQRVVAFAADAKNSAEVNQVLDGWLEDYHLTRAGLAS